VASIEAGMVPVPDHYIERLKEQILTLEDMLEPLESGKIIIGDSEKTAIWIAHLKKTIAMYREIVDSKNA
jgi:hypothetical protein